MRLFSLSTLRSLWRDRRGNALMITAFALPVIVGGAGLGVHSIQLTVAKRQLQREADSAALAGAHSLYQDQTDSSAVAASNQALAQNPLVTGATPTVQVTGSYTSSGTTYAKTMFVRLTHDEPTSFMSLFGINSATVVAEARAATAPIGDFCFLALEDGNNTGIIFGGNATIDLDCGVATNSTHGTMAIRANGNPTVIATPLIAQGMIENSTAFSNSTQMEDHDELTNPFDGMSLNPSSSTVSNGQCKNGQNWKTITDANWTTATPGCYGKIDINGTVTLPDGTYYIADHSNQGGLVLGASANLTCNACTFVLTSTTNNQAATMSINGNAELHLGPPTSGTYDGITIYRDSRAAASNQCCTINGNANSDLSGAYYFPNDELTFNGNAGMTLECFQLVALRLQFTGNPEIDNSCPDRPGNEDDWTINAVRLIG